MIAAYACRNCGGIAPLRIHLILMANKQWFGYCTHCESYREFKGTCADFRTVVKWRG